MEANQPLDRDFAEGLQLSHEARNFLQETARWSRFLSILGFVFLGLIVLMGIFAGTFMGILLGGFPGSEFGALSTGIFTAYFFVIALIYFFPILYLYRFSTNMIAALRDEDEISLTTSFANLKSHYKFIGILTAIILGFYVLAMGMGLLAGVATGI